VVLLVEECQLVIWVSFAFVSIAPPGSRLINIACICRIINESRPGWSYANKHDTFQCIR